MSTVDTFVETFSADGEQWTQLEGGDLRVSLMKIDKRPDNLFVKVALTPEKTLARDKLNFVRAKVMPTALGYKLPMWVDLWSVTVDGAAKTFDGSKTLNLSRLLSSLKDSVFVASRPALLTIDFVVTP